MNAQERADDPVEDFQVASQISARSTLASGVMSVPLPLDIPPPPNLSSLPAHILHSGTVETLLGQNEDLMARLKVNIRRNSILEQQIMEQDRMHARLKSEHASLIAKFQILEEKSEMISEKSQTFDIELEELRDQLELSQAQVAAAEERSHELRVGLIFEKAYRRRIRKWVRPYMTDLKARVTESAHRSAFLDRQLSNREAVIGDLRERLVASERAMQHAQVKGNQDRALLVESYEVRLRVAEALAVKSRAESGLFRDKALRLDETVSAHAKAENRIVALERKNEQVEQTLSAELKTIQDQLVAFRVEAKELAAEVRAANAERDRARNAETEAIAELERARDQFESLQAVWAEAEKKFENSKLQQDSLNRLNQDLSRQLKTERKAREVSVMTVPPVGSNLATDASTDSAVRVQKIDLILAELESGYSKVRTSDLSKMSSLDFIEDEPKVGAPYSEPT